MRIKFGVDKFIENPYQYIEKGSKIGIVTNATGISSELYPTIDILNKLEHIKVTKLFAGEHGIRGDVPAGKIFDSSICEKTGLPIYSLYSDTKRISDEVLFDLDAIVFDMQDLGVRYYTYLATLKYIIEACGKNGVKLVIFDRPNPIACKIFGNVLEKEFVSFVGPTSMAIGTGLTIGEFAKYIKAKQQISVNLTVVEMENWKSNMWIDEIDTVWIPPSPNIPNKETVLYYPLTCFIEGTNLSEGRGTTKPFEYIGAPWLDNETVIKHLKDKKMQGLAYISTYFTPVTSKYKNEFCRGIHFIILDRNKLDYTRFSYELIQTLKTIHPHQFDWIKGFNDEKTFFIDYLTGTDKVRKAIDRGLPYSHFKENWESQCHTWYEKILPFKIYMEGFK